MLGEKIHEITGKITGMRVLPGADPGHHQVEVSYQGTGKLMGVETTEMGTYIATKQPSGVLAGTGQGITVTKDGESVHWHGEGIGKPTGKGMGVSWRGGIYYRTASQKLAPVNTMAMAFEWETDENGNAKGAIWEWR